MFKNNIGDSVEIVDQYCCFTVYQSMAEVMKLSQWAYEELPNNGDKGEIVARGYHLGREEEVPLYGVRINDKSFIMGEGAIQEINNFKSKVSKKFNV